jgi:hypothetical protein
VLQRDAICDFVQQYPIRFPMANHIHNDV